MELRSCNHLHFIQAIRSGSVVKTLNIDSRGRPALLFKKIKDIYETEGFDSLLMPQPKDGFRGLHFDCDRDKIESPCSPMGEQKTIKSEPETYGFSHACDDERDSDLDDLSFGKMTLKQLKKRCKTKKRKLSTSMDLTKENVETCSPQKQDYSDSQPEEDEFYLKEPLSSWKSKLTKKKKKKCINKYLSSSSQSTISVKSEEIPSDQYVLHFSRDSSASINVKVEVNNPNYVDCENVVCVADDSSIGCNEKVVSCGVVSSEILETADECVVETGESISFTEEPRSCVLNEVSYDHIEHAKPNSLPIVLAIGMETMNVDDPEMTSHESSVLPVSDLKKQDDITHLAFNEISPEGFSPPNEHNSHVFVSSQSLFFPCEMSWQINSNAGVQWPDMANDSSLQCLELSHGGGACVFEDDSKNNLPSNTEAGAIGSCVNNHSSSWNSNPCPSTDSCLVSLDDDSPRIDVEQSLMSASGYTPRNCSAGIHSCDSSFGNSNPCSSLDSCLVSVDDDSPTSDEKQQSLMSSSGYTASNCSAEIHLYDARDELPKSEVVGDHNHSELQHPPERLFSTRKAISPTSQERLCKAMDSVELPDDLEYYKCRGKLYFEKQTEKKAPSAGSDLEGAEVIINVEGPEQIDRAEVTINCKRIMRKPKNKVKGSPPKGILKVPHLSRELPCASAGGTSIQSCTEDAIAFSQRQMHDIESLAARLTKELKSMKDIVEETLHSEACQATTLKYNADEVRISIENATKVEDTTRKWLSMMARDCNRFCKIMRSNEKGTAYSGTTIHKERKKITFADEAGGKLCHVKVFEDSTMASMEPNSE